MRLASTVMLLRDTQAGIEVLMVRRSSRSAFAPDAFVFPGGTVDAVDFEIQPGGWSERIAVEFRARAAEALPSSERAVSEREAAALVAAALRELREEAAIDLAPDALYLFSHWITPPTEPRRYNTHFFLARASDGAHGTADAVETHDAQWIAPAAALDRYVRGEMHLVYPTVKHLERLAGFSTVDALIEYTRRKPIVTIMPSCSPSEGFVMPAHLEEAW